MDPDKNSNADFKLRTTLQFSVLQLLWLTTAVAIGLAVVTNYPRVAVAISVMLIATVAIYYSDRLLQLANSDHWTVLTEAILAIVGTTFIVMGIFCHLTYGQVLKTGAQVWLLSTLLIVAGLLCILRAWVLTMRRSG